MKKGTIKKTMNCLECGSPTEKGVGTANYPKFGVTVSDVPALVCPNCGEVYLHGPSLGKIERDLAKDLKKAA